MARRVANRRTTRPGGRLRRPVTILVTVAAKPPPTIAVAGGLTLQREAQADSERVARAVRDNLEHLHPWMPWATAEAAEPASQRARLIQAEQAWEQDSTYSFLLLRPPSRVVLGVFGLHRRIGRGGLEIGYWLDRRQQRRGYATEAARALTNVALGLEEVSRVEIRCDEANLRSEAIPRRLGYVLERIETDLVTAPAEVGRSMIWVTTSPV